MEMIKIQTNPIGGYQPQPTLPFDIEGTLLSKEGKHIIIGAEIEGKKVEFDLRLNEEITQEVGEKVHIEKEKVVSHTVRKEAFGLEGAGEEGNGARDVRRILEELDLSHTTDNVKLIEWMITAGIELTRDTVHSFLVSEKYLQQLQKEMSIELIAKMTLRGMNVEHMSLQELSDSVSELKNESEKKSIAQWLGWERDLNYEEAEQVAKQLYGQKMGKDVYDAIIQLRHFNGELSKKNINHITDLLAKIKSLKDISIQTFVAMQAVNADYTIYSLYRTHRSFAMTSIMKNEQSHSFDLYTTTEDNRIGIERLIHLSGVEKNSMSFSIFRELTAQGMTANKENYQKVLNMKEIVEKILPQLNTKTITLLETKGFDIGNTSIEELHRLLQDPVTELQEKILSSPDISKMIPDKSTQTTPSKIGIRELISLIRSESDMTLNELQKKLDVIKTIDVKEPVVLRTISMTQTLKIIGEHLTTEVISRAHAKDESLSLQTLEEAAIEKSQSSDILIRPVSESASMLIREEYMRIRSGLTISMISRSVRENFDLEHAPLSQVDAFIKKGHEIYEQAKDFHLRLRNTVGQSKVLIPTIMKNSLDMNLREIMEISHFLNGMPQIEDSLGALNATPESPRKKILQQLEKKLSDKIHTGEVFAQEYQALIQAQTDFSGKNSDQGHSKDHSNSFMLGTIKKLSRGTIVMQIPIELDGKENQLNVLIPRNKYGLSKKEMSFLLSLRTEELGMVNMALEVSGKNIHLKFEEENQSLKGRIPKLRNILSEKGYQLKVENLK